MAGISGNLRRSFADCVLEFGSFPGAPDHVVIPEHTRSPRRTLPEQLAGCRINWRQQYADRNAHPTTLTFLVHSGRRPLRVPGARMFRRDGWYFMEQDELRVQLVCLDLPCMPYDALSRCPATRAVLGAFAAERVEPTPRASIRRIFRDLNTVPWSDTLWHKVCRFGHMEFMLDEAEYRALIPWEDRRLREVNMAMEIQKLMDEREAIGLAQGLERGREGVWDGAPRRSPCYSFSTNSVRFRRLHARKLKARRHPRSPNSQLRSGTRRAWMTCCETAA